MWAGQKKGKSPLIKVLFEPPLLIINSSALSASPLFFNCERHKIFLTVLRTDRYYSKSRATKPPPPSSFFESPDL